MLSGTGTIRLVLTFCFAVCLVCADGIRAKTTHQLPPNQPEQDACGAIQLCGSSFSTPYSYTGTGQKLDLDSTPCSPDKGGGETNSVWLQIHIALAETVLFTLTPVSAADDYDFAVLNVTGKDCGLLSLKDVVSCNFNANVFGNVNKGVVGISDTARTLYVKNGTAGSSFSKAVYASGDETYLIMVNNYGNYGSGQPSAGFTIDFSGSTASFYNAGNPEILSVDGDCTDNTSLTVKLNTEILCSSIAGDGSDFTINAPVKIVSASGINCAGKSGYTNSVILHFDSSPPAGSYTVGSRKGSDGNSLIDLCGNELSLLSSTVPFILKPGGKVHIEKEFICYQELPYQWNGIQITAAGDGAATYTTRSVDGCDSTTILNLSVSPTPRQANLSATICDGDSYTLPWNADATGAGTYIHHYTDTKGCDTLVETVIVNVFTPPNGNTETRDSTIQTGFCERGSVLLKPAANFATYLWNTGQTSSSIIVNIAGAYGLMAKDEYGCITIDTFVVAAYPRPATLFRRIESLCIDSIKHLDAGGGFTDYLWNNGSTEQTVVTDHPGMFWVRLTDAYNCTGTDTVNVVTVPRPSNFLPGPITKCSFKEITVMTPISFLAYTWSNGSHAAGTQVAAGGQYVLTVTDINQCVGHDSITVTDSVCPEYFYIPSAFMPNHDGRNDLFKPRFAGTLSGYSFAVYNRWGRLVFSTRNDTTDWDCTTNGFSQTTGVYLWICTYSLNGKPLQAAKGSVTLIR